MLLGFPPLSFQFHITCPLWWQVTSSQGKHILCGIQLLLKVRCWQKVSQVVKYMLIDCSASRTKFEYHINSLHILFNVEQSYAGFPNGWPGVVIWFQASIFLQICEGIEDASYCSKLRCTISFCASTCIDVLHKK